MLRQYDCKAQPPGEDAEPPRQRVEVGEHYGGARDLQVFQLETNEFEKQKTLDRS